MLETQVEQSHYEFYKYMHLPRWISIWHQLNEVLKLKPKNVLEIGVGTGIFKNSAICFDVHVETLDIDPALNPDHVASVFEMPFADRTFDVVCAFQMLEHLPFEQSLQALSEMSRVAKKAVIISLPDATKSWPISIHIPKFGLLKISINPPRITLPKHKFDGEHYWEINKSGYSLKHVQSELEKIMGRPTDHTFRVHEHSYHRFFIFKMTT